MVYSNHIPAWASALLVFAGMGNARASKRGTSNSTDSTLFYMPIVSVVKISFLPKGIRGGRIFFVVA